MEGLAHEVCMLAVVNVDSLAVIYSMWRTHYRLLQECKVARMI